MDKLVVLISRITFCTVLLFGVTVFVCVTSVIPVFVDLNNYLVLLSTILVLIMLRFVFYLNEEKVRVEGPTTRQLAEDLKTYATLSLVAAVLFYLTYLLGRIFHITGTFTIYDQNEIKKSIDPFLNQVEGNAIEMQSLTIGKSEAVLLYWEPSGDSVGHVSLLLVNHTFVSGWPLWDESQSKNMDLFKPTRRHMNRTLSDDIQDEGQYPSAIVLFPADIKLDYEKMLLEWEHTQSTSYILSINNCAQTVYRILEAGGFHMSRVMGDVKRLSWIFHGPSDLVWFVADTICAKSQTAAGWVGKLVVMTNAVTVDLMLLKMFTAVIQTIIWCYRWKTHGPDELSMTFIKETSGPMLYYHAIKVIGFYYTGETSRLEYVTAVTLIWIFKYFLGFFSYAIYIHF